jgi:hypothetical protein
MKKNQKSIIIFLLSMVLASLVIIASSVGLFIPETYTRESANWVAQAIGQDFIDLFLITPVLIISAIFAYTGNKAARLIWSGSLFYLIYTFVIYAFAVHFNNLFIVYCLILGLSFYLFIYFIISNSKKAVSNWFKNKVPYKLVGIYLIVIACLFYLLWLSELIPAICSNSIPKSLADTGLLTNPVHALDLSVCLPAIFISGILLLKKNYLGLLLAPTMLSFCVLMDITIGTLVIVMRMRHLESNMSLPLIMGFLAIVTGVFLYLMLRCVKKGA